MAIVPTLEAAATALQHVPNLVRYGSKPLRDAFDPDETTVHMRDFDEATAYPPHRVFLGLAPPETLRSLPRPWWKHPASDIETVASFLTEEHFYELLAEVDRFGLIDWEPTGATSPAGTLQLRTGGVIAGEISAAHPEDPALRADVLLENLSAQAGAVHAVRVLLDKHDVDPASIDFVVSAGEEAVGDRYQRGGGGMAKAIAEAAGLTGAAGIDLKAFCAAPVHAMANASAMVAAGMCRRVIVVAGGSLSKLGMKYRGCLTSGSPMLEDVLAGFATVIGTGDGPRLRVDAVGHHRVGSGSAQEAVLRDIVLDPLEAMGLGFHDIDIYATELHDPEITEPAGGGNVPDRNARMIAALAVLSGQLSKDEITAFVQQRALPGFSPNQGHIASAVPWVPHALERLRAGSLDRTMLIAKGSLFLGRMTRQWDGISLTMEA